MARAVHNSLFTIGDCQLPIADSRFTVPGGAGAPFGFDVAKALISLGRTQDLGLGTGDSLSPQPSALTT
jgi:hypothetical protein